MLELKFIHQVKNCQRSPHFGLKDRWDDGIAYTVIPSGDELVFSIFLNLLLKPFSIAKHITALTSCSRWTPKATAKHTSRGSFLFHTWVNYKNEFHQNEGSYIVPMKTSPLSVEILVIHSLSNFSLTF